MDLSPSAAPGRLETVRAFVNTWDIEARTEVLTSPAALAGWLIEADLLAAADRAAGELDFERAIALREAIRSILESNHRRAELAPSAVEVVNTAAARARLRPSLTVESRWSVEAEADGVDGALGRLLVIMTTAMNDATWVRLKVCGNDACRWAFYDTSRSRTGRWCSMEMCGNRAKQQAWRGRQDEARS
ncbi:CGNR zinc finger domain-containing protein [Kribbella sp. NPDC056861]|uniref:CGNR zinc finger domain-containing protein n=1 Tax=Kribbella sp. NPDC056861 TaxID=3154857 RepID=UPI0034337341